MYYFFTYFFAHAVYTKFFLLGFTFTPQEVNPSEKGSPMILQEKHHPHTFSRQIICAFRYFGVSLRRK